MPMTRGCFNSLTEKRDLGGILSKQASWGPKREKRQDIIIFLWLRNCHRRGYYLSHFCVYIDFIHVHASSLIRNTVDVGIYLLAEPL